MGTKTKKYTALPKAAEAASSSLLSNETLKLLYASMLKCRALEECASLLVKQWRLAANPGPPAGQEAIKVGCAIDLLPEDVIASPHRDFSAHFIHGLPLNGVFSRLYGCRGEGNGASPGRRPQGPLRAAVVMANKIKKTGKVVVAFSATRANEPPHQVLSRVGFESLPVILVLDNRIPSEIGPAQRAAAKARTLPPRNYGFPSIPVDGDDVVAVYRVAHEAITRARRGDGPTLIECKTYRLDYPMKEPAETRGTADAGGLGRKAGKDPIQHMEQYLKRKGLFQAAWKNQVIRRFSRQLDAAIAASDPPYSRRSIEHAS